MTKGKFILVGLASTITVAALLLSVPQSQVVYQDARVLVKSESSMIGLLAVHHSPIIKAEVFGKAFSDIRGTAPFYLEVKPLRAILLVKEDAQGRVTFVIAYDDTKKISTIKAGRLGFGWNIGSKRSPSEPLSDYVVSADDKTIVLATHGMGWTETIELDLASLRARIVKSETTVPK